MKNYCRVWFITLFLKLAVSALLPLIADEAYYWVWSLFPQWSYFDHPPMTAWLLGLGHFFDFGHSLVRWPGVILGHTVWIIWFFIFQQLKLENKIFNLWFALTWISPLLGFGTLLLTPDLPLLVFWSLSLLFFLKYLDQPKSIHAIFLGTSLGLGFLSKYMIVLFLPLALIALWKNGLLKKFPWRHLHLIAFFGLLFCLPVLIWNYQNSWASFHFQFKHGLEQENFNWRWPAEYLLGQILIIFPLVFFAALGNKDPRVAILKAFAWGPLIFFFLTSFRAPVEGNWPIMAYPAFFVLALTGNWSAKRQWGTVASWLLLYTGLSFGLLFSKNQFVHGKILEPFLYQSFTPLVEKYRPLYAINYQLASSLWFQSKTPVYKLNQSSRYDFFDTLSDGHPSEDHFFVIKQKHHELPSWLIKKYQKISVAENLPNDYLILEVTK